jgi:hypothetical protein
MLTHHLITSSLLTSAYIYGFYNVSNVVLSLMDAVDLLLPVRFNLSPNKTVTNWRSLPKSSSTYASS